MKFLIIFWNFSLSNKTKRPHPPGPHLFPLLRSQRQLPQLSRADRQTSRSQQVPSDPDSTRSTRSIRASIFLRFQPAMISSAFSSRWRFPALPPTDSFRLFRRTMACSCLACLARMFHRLQQLRWLQPTGSISSDNHLFQVSRCLCPYGYVTFGCRPLR